MYNFDKASNGIANGRFPYYSLTGIELFARRIAREMVPRVNAIARLGRRYQTGQMSYDTFVDFSVKEQRGARVYIFDTDGNIVAYTGDEEAVTNGLVTEKLSQYAKTILQDKTDLISTDWRSAEGIVVGVPIKDNLNRVFGAVIMTKPSTEVHEVMSGIIRALMLGCLAVFLLMIVPAYLVSKRISNPIRNMTEASIAMAGGNFSVRADETHNDEIGMLGSALNYLSASLNDNISNLTLTRNRLHVILEGLHEGVVAYDRGGNIVFSNTAALTLFGCADQSALDRKLEQAADIRKQIDETKQTQVLQLDEAQSKLLLTISPSQGSGDALSGTVTVIQDITAAERLEQTRRDYVANVSHELRTPIASIRSLSEALNDGLIKTEDDRQRYYGYILRESMRLTRLINDLLELSRLQSGSVALEKHTFDIRLLLNEVYERIRIDASYSGIDVVLQEPNGLCSVLSNRDRIEQVLIALTNNAIKYASDDGTVVLETADAGDHIDVLVKNSGHIAEKDLGHIFERFYKADNAHSEGGTGLGLSIVQEILSLLGERIEAYNTDTEVVFRFTVAKADR